MSLHIFDNFGLTSLSYDEEALVNSLMGGKTDSLPIEEDTYVHTTGVDKLKEKLEQDLAKLKKYADGLERILSEMNEPPEKGLLDLITTRRKCEEIKNKLDSLENVENFSDAMPEEKGKINQVIFGSSAAIEKADNEIDEINKKIIKIKDKSEYYRYANKPIISKLVAGHLDSKVEKLKKKRCKIDKRQKVLVNRKLLSFYNDLLQDKIAFKKVIGQENIDRRIADVEEKIAATEAMSSEYEEKAKKTESIESVINSVKGVYSYSKALLLDVKLTALKLKRGIFFSNKTNSPIEPTDTEENTEEDKIVR